MMNIMKTRDGQANYMWVQKLRIGQVLAIVLRS